MELRCESNLQCESAVQVNYLSRVTRFPLLLERMLLFDVISAGYTAREVK